jgi:hypothetical protein
MQSTEWRGKVPVDPAAAMGLAAAKARPGWPVLSCLLLAIGLGSQFVLFILCAKQFVFFVVCIWTICGILCSLYWLSMK